MESLLPTMATTHKIIPHTVRSQAKEAFVRYPVAMALQAALAGYHTAKSALSKPPASVGVSVGAGANDGAAAAAAAVLATRQCLLVGHLQAVRDVVKEAVGGSKKTRRWVKWDAPDLNDWVAQLSSKVGVGS